MTIDWTYQTKDLNVSAVLSYFGFTVIDVTKVERQATFSFEDNDRIQQVVDKYWQGSLNVEPLKYNSHLKNLKTRIFNQ